MISHHQHLKECREYPSLDGYKKIASTALQEKNYNAVIRASELAQNYQGVHHFIYKFPNGYGAMVISEKNERDLSDDDSVLIGMNQLKKDPDLFNIESFKSVPYSELANELEQIFTLPNIQ